MESQERALHELHRCRIAATSLYGTDSPPEYSFSHSGTETVQIKKDVSKFFEHTLHEHDMSVASLQSTLPAGSVPWTQLVDTFRDLSWHMPGSEQLLMMSKVKLPPDVSILHQDWQGYYVQEPLYQGFWQELESDAVARDGVSNSFFFLYKGKVRYNTKICVPQGILDKVIKGTHTYAHPGIDKTIQHLNRKFVVPDPEFTQSKLKTTVSKVVGHCRVCQTTKHRKGVQADTLDHYPIPDNIFDSIAVDFLDLTGNPVTEGKVEYNYVLVVVCRLSRYIIAIPCHNTLTSKELARIFVHPIFPHWGLPSVIFSDNDHLVNAHFCKEFFMLSGVEEHKSPIYKPKANGRAENAVQLVVCSLRKLLEQKGTKKWVQLLLLAVWAPNDTPGPVSEYSPYRIVFVRNPVGFGDCPPTIPQDGCQDAEKFFLDLVATRKFVEDTLTKVHARLSEEFLRKHPREVLRAGDKVWIKVNRKGMDRDYTKLDRVWKGPAEILQRVGVDRYKVVTEKGEKILHTVDLKPCPDPLDQLPPPYHWYTSVEDVMEQDKYVVESVLNDKMVGTGKE